MISKKYKIAGKVVEINSIYEDVHKYCSKYLTDELPDYTITIEDADIDYEVEVSEKEKEKNPGIEMNFDRNFLEILAVYRKIADKMIEYDTVLFHGSAISVDGVAYLFTAKSGTGKSTHTRLWREYLGDKAIMVNDDKPLIKIGDEVLVCGTPYNGKHKLGNNISVPLKSICILTRSEENHIEKITKQQAYTMILQQTNRPRDLEKMKKTLELIDKLMEKVDLYLLGCNMDLEAAKVSYEGMK